ncbi:hypothetical protein [Roseovarius sp. D0-M9]|uniref:hypothetical protein n=1 Tax=Roseovarius sp. D0-M9 TaxID=3127117 RepID=UPI0030100D77
MKKKYGKVCQKAMTLHTNQNHSVIYWRYRKLLEAIFMALNGYNDQAFCPNPGH